jgi:hypothetical protein
MSEEVANEVLRWLQGARETIEQQAPVLAREIIRYAIVSDIGGLLVGVALVSTAAWCARRWYGFKREHPHSSVDDEPMAAAVGGWIAGLLGALVFVVALFDLIWALMAPHWYVLHAVLPGKS